MDYGYIGRIMQSSIGEASQEICATFKKTVKIREYESEAFEASTRLIVPKTLTGIERMVISAILKAQMEYTVYLDLYEKGLVTETEFNDRKEQLDSELYSLHLEAANKGIEVKQYFGL